MGEVMLRNAKREEASSSVESKILDVSYAKLNSNSRFTFRLTDYKTFIKGLKLCELVFSKM